jgi:glycosyltransferase involved in cell wall biosynthesis
MKKPKVTFFCIYAQNYFDRINGFIGGAEKQAIMMAKFLSENQRFSVSLMVADPGRNLRRSSFPHGIEYEFHPSFKIDGTRIRVSPKQGLFAKVFDKARIAMGLPIRNAKNEDQKRIEKPYIKSDASLWVCVSLSDPNFELAFYCFKYNKPFIVVVAANIDFDFIEIPLGKDMYDADRSKKRQILNWASAIVVQNQYQFGLVEGYFPQLPRFYLPNPINLFPVFAQTQKKTNQILWVGRFDSNKDPISLCKLAKKLPEAHFLAICNPSDPDLELEFHEFSPANVELIQFVPAEKMRFYFSQCILHISTSKMEGFPNTFLEAAAESTPTFSLNVDPNSLMSSETLGLLFSGDLEQMATTIKEYLSNPGQLLEMGKRARTYVEKVHDSEVVSREWLHIVEQVLELPCAE